MKLQTVIGSILIISIIVVGFYTFLGDLASESAYNVEVNESHYNTTFEVSEKLSIRLNQTYEKLQTLPTNKAAAFFTGMAEGISTITFLISTPFKLIGPLWQSFSITLGIPSWFTPLLLSFVTLVFVFGIIAAILRWRT